MRLGYVYSFISTNEMITEFAFEGLQLAPSDFTEFDVRSFFDPKPVLLLDGRTRIYVAALIAAEDGSQRQAIVSASSE